jgi:methionyl-tRNA formyltransferase
MTTPHNPILRRPAEKILVVSENQELSLCLRDAIDQISFDHPLSIDFCYTALNHSPQQMIDIGATEINVKEPATIEKISAEYDLVFSLHCKQIFPKQLVESVRCINFHPGVNPYNRGWFPQAFSIVNRLPIGATIHLMDADVDHGEIIAQQRVDIDNADTSLEVYRKVIQAEKELIALHIFDIIEGAFSSTPAGEEGNYNSIKDYREMCVLDLDSVGSLGEHLNLLRATTHGNFRNAHFVGADGKKYFVRISIEADLSE